MTMPVVHAIPDPALGNTSYLVEIGDEALSIDPRRDVDEHLALASERDLRIVAVLETHLHADFVSGSRELSRYGAEVVAASAAGLEFAHRGVAAGERLDFGRCAVDVLATPGHTPEHVSYLLRSGDELAIFSGGSLIAGGAARTDLTGSDHTEELARKQFASLRSLAALPDHTTLHPTHGSGSFCSAGSVNAAATTIGEERATNSLLAIEDENAFVEAVLQRFGSYPRYFLELREVNRRGAPVVSSLPGAAEIGPEHVGDAWLVDARPVEEWAREHARGSVSIELREAFASWLGWTVPFGTPFVLMLERDAADEAVRLARRIGYDAIQGWLTFDSWLNAGLPTTSVESIEPLDALERVNAGAMLLDVRQTAEFDARHIRGARHLELGDVIAGKTPDAVEVVTYCGHGERSATAASLLARRGVRVANLRGGAAAWRAAGLETEEP